MKDRIEELQNFYQEAQTLPDELSIDAIKKRVTLKAKGHHVKHALRYVALTAATFLGILTVGVNTSETFANAVYDIPILEKLAKAVSWNKGYEDAIQNEFAQIIGQTASTEHLTIELDSIISDEKNLVLFFRFSNVSKDYRNHLFSMEFGQFINADTGEELSIGHGILENFIPNDDYWILSIGAEDFQRARNLTINLAVNDLTANTVDGNLQYTIALPEPAEPNIFSVNQDFEISGQRFSIRSVTVHPTCAYIDVAFDESNTMDFLNMNFSLINENGEEWSRTNGLYTVDTEDGIQYYLESSYFSGGKELTLCLNQVELLSSDKKRVTYNLYTKEFSDCDGIMKELICLDKTPGGSDDDNTSTLYFKYTNPSYEWHPFNEYIDRNGEEQFLLGIGVGIDPADDASFFAIWNIASYDMDTDGNITFIRNFPEYAVNPQIRIELK